MAIDNLGKWHNFLNGVVLHGPPGSSTHNLNESLQKRIANELDAVFSDLLSGAVITNLAVTLPGGLAVDIASGTAYLEGQRIRKAAISTVSGLPPSTSGIKIYIEATTPYSPTNSGWPALGGFTTGSLSSSQLLLATVATDGSNVTANVDGRVFAYKLINIPSPAEKAGLVGTAGTPGAGNPYVTTQDTRISSLPGALILQSPNLTLYNITVTDQGILQATPV
jgi:hypothetical protein